MVDVNPFPGLRFDLSQVGDLSDVTAPPYDVIDTACQDRLYKRHPCNIVRVDLNRSEPNDPTPEEKYIRAARFFKHWQLDGVLIRERSDALYVYDQEFEWNGTTYRRRGFMGRLRLEEFCAGNVFPHEETLSGPKVDRLLLTRACRANLSPVFGLYPDEQQVVQNKLDDHCASLTGVEARDDQGVVHRMWVVTDPGVINAVREQMRDKPVFIADGHHRYETSLTFRRELSEAGQLDDDNSPENFILMHFVGMQDPGLQILPTHRLVSGLPGWTGAELSARLSSHFELEFVGVGEQGARETWEMIELEGLQSVFGIGSAIDGSWYFARAIDTSPMESLASEHSAEWRELGVSILHRLAIDYLLAGPDGAASDGSSETVDRPTFRYVHTLQEVVEAQRSGACGLACLVPPATIDHIEMIALNRETMPAKSTYFYPKLLTGMVLNPLS